MSKLKEDVFISDAAVDLIFEMKYGPIVGKNNDLIFLESEVEYFADDCDIIFVERIFNVGGQRHTTMERKYFS